MTTASGTAASESGALSGVNVLDLSRLLPGPYCSMILADHGARVIALEDRRFASEGLVTPLYRNKQHMTLNLRSAEGKEVFTRLVRRADVLIEGFRPGVAARLGVDYAAACRENPRIVYCSITGYGQTGRLRMRVGHDANYLAQAGALDLCGDPDRPPAIPGVQIADIAGGGMNAAIGILLALWARQRTGRGQHIDISMTDGVVGMLPVALLMQELTGTPLGRSDWLLSHRYACYTTYETADGRHLAIGAVENRFWKRLCEHFGVPEFAALQYDEARRKEIIAFMQSRFRSKPLSAWDAELGDLEVCYAPVCRLQEVVAEHLFREREALVMLEDPGGTARPAVGIPVRLSDTPGAVRTPPPVFGQDTQNILDELGYSRERIEQFAADGVI
jgi:crotonobetainyl-CoA:carnitine CoA-transferase CaiB-like acyl-CoA transferase